MQIIYVEQAIIDHPRVAKIISQFKHAKIITCEHYGEIFNIKAQNFRLQKQHPALILAQKQNQLVLPTPERFSIGGEKNYYFSHMLNCIYDCRYCFLQGMYPSANYVIFINYEDFQTAINEVMTNHLTNLQQTGAIIKDEMQKVYFFSGYDGDSLAYEPITQFIENFLPFFANTPYAILELRTKSTNIKSLLRLQAITNCIVAFSFTPQDLSTKIEFGVPSVTKRIQAMKKLAEKGWKIGLRFDPLLYTNDFETHYRQLVGAIFCQVASTQIHSITLGALRFPIPMFRKLIQLYPNDALLAQPLQLNANQMSYSNEKEEYMKKFIINELQPYVDNSIIHTQ